MGSYRLVGAALLTIALFLNVTCIFTPGWLYDSAGCFNGTCYADGLARGFFVQLTGNSTSKVHLDRVDISVIALNGVGDLFIVIAIVAVIYSHAKNVKGTFGKIGGFLGLIGGFFIMVGMTCFTIKWEEGLVKRFKVSWGYSYALSWFSFCLAGIGGITSVGLRGMIETSK